MYLRCLQLFMARDRLNMPRVCAVLQHRRRHAVPEDIAGSCFLQLRSSRIAFPASAVIKSVMSAPATKTSDPASPRIIRSIPAYTLRVTG
jgi:hypothetical protein